MQASDRAPGDSFAHAAALSADGDVALVGADGKDVHAGAAYIFTSGKADRGVICSQPAPWTPRR